MGWSFAAVLVVLLPLFVYAVLPVRRTPLPRLRYPFEEEYDGDGPPPPRFRRPNKRKSYPGYRVW